jgi:hypothetical protein
MTPEVIQAIEEIKNTFSGKEVESEEEAQGGTFVTVYGLDLGSQYSPSEAWISFLIGFQYPMADVYPHYLDGVVNRADGKEFGEGFSRTNWRDKVVIQISRRSNRLDPLVDSAATKLLKVLEWIRKQ